MRCLVTGATGFIGSRVAGALARRDHEIFALARSQGAAERLTSVGLVPVRGDLGEPAGLRELMTVHHPTAVVHLAALIATTRDPHAIARVNTEGTEALASAAVDAGVRRFVFASTVVTGEADGALLEESKPLPVATAYGRSKQASEAMLAAHRAHRRLESVTLRPSHVYGAGGWFANLVKDARRGLFRLPGGGANLWDMVHVDDVVDAFVRAVEADAPSEVYHVVDDTPVTMRAVADCIAEALGKRPFGTVPIWLARLLRGRPAIDAAVRSARSSNARIKAELGWAPTHPSSLESIGDVVRELAGPR